jgi:hypothetical protein
MKSLAQLCLLILCSCSMVSTPELESRTDLPLIFGSKSRDIDDAGCPMISGSYSRSPSSYEMENGVVKQFQPAVPEFLFLTLFRLQHAKSISNMHKVANDQIKIDLQRGRLTVSVFFFDTRSFKSYSLESAAGDFECINGELVFPVVREKFGGDGMKVNSITYGFIGRLISGDIFVYEQKALVDRNEHLWHVFERPE